MTGATIDHVVLDHVAHAVPRWQDVWHRYVVDLGAFWRSGGLSSGFAPAQLEFGNGSRLELLMPNDTEANDFLARFIAGNGPGPHHLTFKVPDLALALERTASAGYDPIGIDLSDPAWMEAFIHPKQASGVVVQLAQADIPWFGPVPEDFPTHRRQRQDGTGPALPASLRWVTHAVAELDSASALFVGLLGAQTAAHGSGDEHRWMELSWGGPLGLRLVSPTGTAPTPLRRWLRGRSGRVHHLELSVEEAEGLPGAHRGDGSVFGLHDARSDPYWVIPPEENAGLRLIIRDERIQPDIRGR